MKNQADSSSKQCPFCALAAERVVLESALSFAIADGFPVSKGHALVIPKRHVASFFALTESERQDLMELVVRTKEQLDGEHRPDGYNLGINDGAAAGQTIFHLHVHIIPRYAGDSRDPRGGVRWIKPEKARYWEEHK